MIVAIGASVAAVFIIVLTLICLCMWRSGGTLHNLISRFNSISILFSRRWKKEQQKADLLHPAYRQQAAAAAAAAASYMNAQGHPGRPPPSSYLASKSAGLGRYCSMMCSRIQTYLAILGHSNSAYFMICIACEPKQIQPTHHWNDLIVPFRRRRALSAAGRADPAGRSTTAGRRWRTGCGGRRWPSRGSTRPHPSPRTSTR